MRIFHIDLESFQTTAPNTKQRNKNQFVWSTNSFIFHTLVKIVVKLKIVFFTTFLFCCCCSPLDVNQRLNRLTELIIYPRTPGAHLRHPTPLNMQRTITISPAVSPRGTVALVGSRQVTAVWITVASVFSPVTLVHICLKGKQFYNNYLPYGQDCWKLTGLLCNSFSFYLQSALPDTLFLRNFA